VITANLAKGKKPGEFDIDQWVDKKEQQNTPAFVQFALAAAEQALTDAAWRPTTLHEQETTGVALGTGIGSLEDIVDTVSTLNNEGYRKVSPHFIPKILQNMAAGRVSLQHKLKGPNIAPVTACATGANAIGDAARLIQLGQANAMLAGGTEACIQPLAVAGFSRMRALSTKFNETPELASRPFDADRDGFVIGEGAGVLLLEEAERARGRGARIYGEVVGYGMAADAYHITAPSPDGQGAYRAMAAALSDAALPTHAVDYINAHATSTPLGDEIENRAIKRLFGPHAYRLAVSSTKGAVGHLLGAAGAVEAAFTLLALHQGVLPPTLNLVATKDVEMDLDYVPRLAVKREIGLALNNSFGFGGTNACLAFAKFS
jgi:3-oxoacyl-[acyl-carrier-protein] synthase II